jgi:voltage-gated potassium channel
MGVQVASEFKREGQPLVVVDKSPELVKDAVARGHPAILGDAGDDDVLKAAGVERAHGLVSAIDDDATNIMVVLSTRALNEKILIVARANTEMTQAKLLSAGANRVLWPYGLGGRRMAQMALRPNVVEFLEVVMHDEELEMWLEEFVVAIGSVLDNVEIGSASIRGQTGANIVALRQRTGRLIAAPTPETILQAGDILVAVGTRDQLKQLRGLAHG